jgi:hypothetical protein
VYDATPVSDWVKVQITNDSQTDKSDSSSCFAFATASSSDVAQTMYSTLFNSGVDKSISLEGLTISNNVTSYFFIMSLFKFLIQR